MDKNEEKRLRELMNQPDETPSGWTQYPDCIFHFEHISKTQAEKLTAKRSRPHMVIAVNWSVAKGAEEYVHLNRYFVNDYQAAIAKACQLELAGEEVVEIVLATPSEEVTVEELYEKFADAWPTAVAE